MKTGGMIVRVVTVGAGAAQATRRTVRRTTRRGAGRACAVRTFDCLTMAGRAGGFSATWTAPPPTIAPPAVQAQSFAKAIRTDISASRFLAGRRKAACPLPISVSRRGCRRADANHGFKRKRVNPFRGSKRGRRAGSVPKLHSLCERVNGPASPARDHGCDSRIDSDTPAFDSRRAWRRAPCVASRAKTDFQSRLSDLP